MNDRFGNERDRRGNYGQPWGDERSDWSRERNERSGWRREGSDRSGWARGEDDRSQWRPGPEDERSWHTGSREPRYSSDYDETYGSEWERGRGEGGGRGNYDRPGYVHGAQAAGYGQGERGFYGRGGNSSSTEYGPGGSRFGGGNYGSTGYGGAGRAPGWGHERGFGGGWDPGFRGPDLQSPGTDLRSNLRGGFAGRGPKNYVRTDERIREDVCDRLSVDDDVDASEIEVRVQNGEVMLEGSVPTRSMKHRAEDIAEDVGGVKDVHNHLRVIKSMLTELKDKVTGKEAEQHYANSGTKNAPASASMNRTGANGTL